VYVFTGTTKDEILKDAIINELEENEDLKEAELIRNAVVEYLGVE